MERTALISLTETPKRELANDSWSSLLIHRGPLQTNEASLGYTLLTPGTVTESIRHDCEELVYVVQGIGDMHLDEGPLHFHAGHAIWIPVGTWHAFENTGHEDIVMVFSFPHHEYPVTQLRINGDTEQK